MYNYTIEEIDRFFLKEKPSGLVILLDYSGEVYLTNLSRGYLQLERNSTTKVGFRFKTYK